MIYIACFALSTLFAFMAHKTKKKWLFFAFSALSILLPVLLAGLRDYSIGTDVKNYLTVDRFWGGAIKADSLIDYLVHYVQLGKREVVFAAFIGTIAQVFGSYRLFLFCTHIVIVTAVYIGAFRLRHRAHPALILLLFYLMYYNASLNVLRQYMAMAIVFAFLADLEQRKFLRYSIAVLCATLVHNTAILAFAPLVLFLILFPKKELKRASNKRWIFIVSLIVFGTLLFIPVVRLSLKIGLLDSKYNFYFKDEVSRYAITRLGLRFLEITGIVVLLKKLRSVDYTDFYIANAIMFIAMLMISNFIVYGQRIPAHFSLANIVMVSMFPQCFEKKKWRHLCSLLIIVLLAYYWYHTYVHGGASETIPYIFGV